MSVGQKIRALRERRNLSQQELAEMAGISQPYLSGVELGTKNLSFEQARLIKEALGVSFDELAAS